MRIYTAAACFLAGALVLPAAGYTADSDANRLSATAYVKDSVITTKVKSKLAEEKLANALHIKVSTNDQGVVTLSGSAKTRDEAAKAVSIARSVDGVTKVDNMIKVEGK